MLLYMNDTWNKLQQSTEVQDALRNGTATKPELLAAGYNSNPMRLSGYLKNGGTGWRTLIPAETQIYLKIYAAIDSTLELKSNSSRIDDAATNAQVAVAISTPSRAAAMLSWLGRSLTIGGSFLTRFLD